MTICHAAHRQGQCEREDGGLRGCKNEPGYQGQTVTPQKDSPGVSQWTEWGDTK